MIKLENINKYFNRHKKNEIHVINNTSLELSDTGLTALLGPSGCGKTTLLNTIGGLDKISKGKIYINGKRISKKSSAYVDKIRNLNIGYIFQDYYLVDDMTVYDNVALVLKINGIKSKEEIKLRVNFVLEKVGMYRYRNRLASMLSGGERQRIGIARAIVKDPNIIIADEPTGNLDSKNTLEIMNIIKAISKTRLVILVTHENELAEFYADRIIELKDGTIINDRLNEHNNDLNYHLDNKIYLKDIKNHEMFYDNDTRIDYYSDIKDKLNISIIVLNNNIYIESDNIKKTQLVDEDSAIEIVDDHYKKIDKSIYEEYNFNFDKIINKNIKKKYSSIFNPFNLITNGFKKVRDYSFIKKILLLGFFASGMFILFALSSIFGITDIKDENFVNTNKNYLQVIAKNVKVNNYLEYEKQENINYIIPGNSQVNFIFKFDEYYQTNNMTNIISGSIASIDMIKEKDIILGNSSKEKYDIILDKLTIDNFLKQENTKMSGIISYKDLLNKKLYINNMNTFTIVGIVDLKSPSIYVSSNLFINIIANSKNNNDSYIDSNGITPEYIDYLLVKDKITLKKGYYPTNDYEVMVNINYRDSYPLKKEINKKINGKKLKVVGYYDSPTNMEILLVSNNTIKYYLIETTSDIIIYPKNKDLVMNNFRENNINIKDTYTYSKENYIKNIKESIISKLVFAFIVLLISLIEIYLMIRSSNLSRIREIGIYRAIGMKKRDIYKMFLGEIIAITTMASLLGIIFMSYIIKQLMTISYYKDTFVINYKIIILSVILVYFINIIIGLLPVKRTLRKTPARILSRADI